MNVHNCIRCNNPINYDDTDWCDVCDMSVFDERMVKQTKMLKIENYKKFLGKELFGSGVSGSTYWKVTSIMEHLHSYVIFIEQPDMGWERKATLYKELAPKQNHRYKIECGTEVLYLDKDSLKNVDIFRSNLESFL